MPILKQLVSSSSQSKRRSRMDLTTEMISAPLGDFRHTMHVGRSGDAFGDTSFLGSRTGDTPSDAGVQPRSPKPNLLSRTFRSSKRSQSVTRGDQRSEALTSPGGSPALVKTALSLPYLNNDDRGRTGGPVSHSLSTSPLRHPDGTPTNGAIAASASLDLEQEEKHFGELTDLPPSTPVRMVGMKHAVSVLSFHVDLGPSMLGDILGVMEREDDDLGYEEGRTSPFIMASGEEEEEEEVEEVKEAVLDQVDVQEPQDGPSSSEDLENQSTGSHTSETCPQYPQRLDTCSISSSGSAALEEKPSHLLKGGDTDSATVSAPQVGDESFFMDEEDDEIRV